MIRIYLICIIIIVIGYLIPQVYAQPNNLVLYNMTISTTEFYNAANSITAGPNFTITGTGNVTFAAPNVYIIGDFVIESGGQFISLNDVVPGIETQDDTAFPTEFALNQSYPNPFNPSTRIRYEIPQYSFVTLTVFDVLGNLVARAVNEEKPAGSYEITFNAENLPSGVYFYRLKAGSFIKTKKMVLMK